MRGQRFLGMQMVVVSFALMIIRPIYLYLIHPALTVPPTPVAEMMVSLIMMVMALTLPVAFIGLFGGVLLIAVEPFGQSTSRSSPGGSLLDGIIGGLLAIAHIFYHIPRFYASGLKDIYNRHYGPSDLEEIHNAYAQGDLTDHELETKLDGWAEDEYGFTDDDTEPKTTGPLHQIDGRNMVVSTDPYEHVEIQNKTVWHARIDQFAEAGENEIAEGMESTDDTEDTVLNAKADHHRSMKAMMEAVDADEITETMESADDDTDDTVDKTQQWWYDETAETD